MYKVGEGQRVGKREKKVTEFEKEKGTERKKERDSI